VKLPVIARAYRERGVLRPLRDDLARTRPEPADEHGGLAPVAPAAPTLSRRGLFALVGGGSAALLLANAGETVGGPFRRLSILAPRRQVIGSGANDFQVNKSAVAAGVTPAMTGAGYRLRLRGGPGELVLSRDELLALPQRTAVLPIACVEGWTTTQEWTGVPLAELARRAGVPEPRAAFVRSLQPRGVLSKASLDGGQIADRDALLALRVNGADLSPDHGFPARIIVPALPGVHATKWVASIDFEATA
jgi:DMSO/TMAO reductase YedYZ molybdopterin-dependent catalytic subunit